MNLKALADNLGLEEDEYMELIELFIETGKADLDKIQSAVEEGNGIEAAHAAHSLKGAAGNLGFNEISEIAMKVEGNAHSSDLNKIAEYVQALKKKLDETAGFAKGLKE